MYEGQIGNWKRGFHAKAVHSRQVDFLIDKVKEVVKEMGLPRNLT